MPKITTSSGHTYDTDNMCDGGLLDLAASRDNNCDSKAADALMAIREQRMRKRKTSCGNRACC